MKKLAFATVVAIGALGLWTASPASAQWKLGKSLYEPCWSIANPVRCDGSYRPHNPDVFELFKRDPGAAQSYWRNR